MQIPAPEIDPFYALFIKKLQKVMIYWNEKCKNGVIPKCRCCCYKKMLSG